MRAMSFCYLAFVFVFASCGKKIDSPLPENKEDKKTEDPRSADQESKVPVASATRFLDICLSKSLTADAQHTLDVVLKEVAKTTDCKSAASKLDGLRNLSLRGKDIVDISLMASFWNLKELDLSENSISDLTPLSSMRPLDKLFLRSNRIVDVAPIKSLVGLRELNLSGNQIVDVSPLRAASKLERLYLSTNRVEDLDPISELKNLQKLHLALNSVEDLTPLNSLQRLEELELSGNRITQLGALSQLKKLRSLFLDDNRLNDLSPIGELKDLLSLSLVSNEIEDANALATLTQLESLDLSDNLLGKNSNESVASLSALLGLTVLNLSGNKSQLGADIPCPLEDSICVYD